MNLLRRAARWCVHRWRQHLFRQRIDIHEARQEPDLDPHGTAW